MSRYLEIIERPTPPSRVRRMWESIRGTWFGPLMSSSPELARVWGDSARTKAGISVTEWNALTWSAVWGAVSLVSDDIASLPLMLYKKLPNGGKDKFEDHSLYRILHDAPNPEMSSMDLRRTLQAHAMIWGNAYAEIERDLGNRPVALWPITPDRVCPHRDERGRLQYRVTNADGRYAFIPADNVIHVKGLGFNGIEGYHVISQMRESISLALAAQQFGETFFGNGSTFGGVLSYPTDPNEQVKLSNRQVLERRHQGVENAHKILAVYGGAKFEPFGVPPDNAQFIEVRTFQIREVCRWFKLPPHKLGDLSEATYSNVEHQNIDYFTSCIRPWLEVWEQELARKLISKLERRQQDIEHVTEGLLRADAAGRGELYSKRFSVGSITPNQIRYLENEDPISGGDEAYVPMNMIPASMARDYWEAQIEAAKAKAQPPEPPPQDKSLEAENARLRDEIDLARRKAQEAEDQRDEARFHAANLEATIEGMKTIHQQSIELASMEQVRLLEAKDSEIASRAAAIVKADELLQNEVEARKVVFRQLADTVTERDEREAALKADIQARDQDCARLADVIAQRDAAIISLTDERDGLAERFDDIDREVVAERERANTVTVERDVALKERREFQSQAADEFNKRLEAENRVGELERSLEEASLKCESLASKHADLIAESLRLLNEEHEKEHEELKRQIEGLSLDVTVANESRQASEAKAEERREKAEAAQKAVTETLAVIADVNRRLDAMIETSQSDRDARLQAELARDEAVTKAELAEGASVDLLEQVRNLSERLQFEQDRQAAMLTAHRGVIVDAMSRMVRRETEKARRNQGTPAKLRNWSESFYLTHEDNCVEALRPAIRAHLAWIGSDEDVDVVARRYIKPQLDGAMHQIRTVAGGDPDDYAVTLERVLTRWEQDRAESLADQIIQEEINHVRSR